MEHTYKFRIKWEQNQARQPGCSCGWRSRYFKGHEIKEAYEEWQKHVQDKMFEV